MIITLRGDDGETVKVDWPTIQAGRNLDQSRHINGEREAIRDSLKTAFSRWMKSPVTTVFDDEVE